MQQISRREFAALVTTGMVAGHVAHPFASGQLGAITAASVIERIKTHIGVDWRSNTVDTVKAGDVSTRVTGVVTTSLATMAVLQQAVKSGANVIVSFEPAFYSRADTPTPPVGRGRGAGPNVGAPPPPPDPVFAAKNEFIARHQLVIFRLNDHWRLRTPDPLAQGIADALGWTNHQVAGDLRRFTISPTTIDALAARLARALGSRGGIRVIGEAQTPVQRVGLLPGSTPIQASLEMMPTVDVIVAGEVREWESVEYVRDVVLSGQRKGMILVGRVVSEEPGMAVCADWLRTIVSEVPVRHIAAGDPYWRPA